MIMKAGPQRGAPGRVDDSVAGSSGRSQAGWSGRLDRRPRPKGSGVREAPSPEQGLTVTFTSLAIAPANWREVTPMTIGSRAVATLATGIGAALALLDVPLPAGEPERDAIRQYQLVADGEAHKLVIREVARPVPGAKQVLVQVRAASLNHRDLAILRSQPRPGGGGGDRGLVPLSDGAGEVIALGPGVTRFRVGDRVAGTFFANWVEGKRNPRTNASARGGAIDGMLSEMVVSHEDGLVEIPSHLSFEEAATLPCAAVTAWTALFTHGRLQPGDFVLLEGTGGVSIFGLQFAAAAGARPIITSSSDAKLERAHALGAFGTVNYRTNPEWQDRVRELTGGAGVAHVLEVGGQETLPRALRALAPGGHIALIGGLTGFVQTMPVGGLMGLGASVTGIYVGSRADFEAMNAFISRHRLRPVIDKAFPFEEAQAAYDLMASAAHLGKIVIRL
jgi:NADPH:quinone reductase-like Zn-dependent oxidoreductase